MSYTIPIGPYHPSLEEPVHARLTVDGEQITDAKVFIGYNHRGIEKLAQERNFIQTDVLVERVCGICSHSHAMTYAMCVEHIAGMEVPKRGQYIRVIISELERIHSHLLWLGIACHIIGHDSLFMHSWNDRERTMDLLEAITGNRVNYAMNTIGGARRDIDDAKRKMILETLDDLVVKMEPLTSFLTNDKTVAMRTQGVGVLTTEDAIRIGAVGPHARASGVDIDVRRDAPYTSYEDFDFAVPVWRPATCSPGCWSGCWRPTRASRSSARLSTCCRKAPSTWATRSPRYRPASSSAVMKPPAASWCTKLSPPAAPPTTA